MTWHEAMALRIQRPMAKAGIAPQSRRLGGALSGRFAGIAAWAVAIVASRDDCRAAVATAGGLGAHHAAVPPGPRKRLA